MKSFFILNRPYFISGFVGLPYNAERGFVNAHRKGAVERNRFLSGLIRNKTLTDKEVRVLLQKKKFVSDMAGKAESAWGFVADKEFHTAMVVFSRAADSAIKAGLIGHAKEYLTQAIRYGKCSVADADEVLSLQKTLEGLK